MKPEIIERDVAYSGYLTVMRLKVRLSDGAVVSRDVDKHGNSVAVLPYSIERRCALVAHLFRAPIFEATGEEISEEACAGMIMNESAVETAHRESLEELGVIIHDLDFVAKVWTSPGTSTERQSLFLANYRASDRVGPGGGAAGEHEGIVVSEQSLESLGQEADNGRIADAKLLVLVLTLRLRRPALFARSVTTD